MLALENRYALRVLEISIPLTGIFICTLELMVGNGIVIGNQVRNNVDSSVFY